MKKKNKRWFFHCASMKKLMIMLILINLLAPIFAQEQQISGIITDSNTNEPLPGVSIMVEGTRNGTTTDINGKYTVKVDRNSILIFSFLGYLQERVTIANQTTVDVKLVSDVKRLDEVVVIGYGVQRKESVTGSVASVKGDLIKEVPSANITTALQGRIAGVDMSQTSTKPGESMQIRIRGTRSLNASNDPLVVLDGIPFAGTIGDINPSDIKSIDILKDASATAIYGSRGANGVILITTNRGSKGQKAKITYNGYVGFKDVFARYPMMSGPEFSAMRNISKKVTNTVDEKDTVNTDWQKLLYRTAIVTSHDLGVSGGTDKSIYSFGAGYYRDEAVVPLQDYTRFSLRASLDQEVGKYIRVGFTTNNNYSITNGANLGAVGAVLAQSPLASPYNADGTPKTTYLQATSGSQWVYTKQTLENLGDKYIDQTKAYSTYNSLYAETKIPGIDGLKYRINLGLNFRQSNYGDFTGVGVFSGNTTNSSTAIVRNEHTFDWAIENLLTYDRSFGKHKINAVGLYSAEQNTYFKSQMNGKDVPADFQFYNIGWSGTITTNPNDQAYTQWGLKSWMGRVMYSYNDRYMLSATLRSDGSSRLSVGNKWNTYPAVSAGWNMKEESFLKPVELISMLKLRVGYGETSNQSVDPYKTLGVLQASPYNYGTSIYSTALYVDKLPNPQLGWEFSRTWNVGLDFALLKNRLSGTVEAYEMNTDNVLLSVNLPVTSGVNGITSNMGTTQNRGVEFSLNGVILDNLSGWTWEAGVNLYVNRNKLTSLASGATKDEGNNWFVGHPIDVYYDYKKVGIWQTTDQYRSILEPAGSDGMIKVRYHGGYNADGSPTRAINATDREVMDIEPNYQGGFNTRLAYKGFDLSVVGAFKNGGILNSSLYGTTSYLNNLNARSNNNVKVDYWSETNTGAKYPKPNGPGGDNPQYGSTLGYFSASYMKIRTISLGYTFNQKWSWVKGAGIDNLRLYCTVQNPFVFFSPYKDESGMDPETNSTSDQNQAVNQDSKSSLKRLLIIGTNTPSTRNVLFGINLSF